MPLISSYFRLSFTYPISLELLALLRLREDPYTASDKFDDHTIDAYNTAMLAYLKRIAPKRSELYVVKRDDDSSFGVQTYREYIIKSFTYYTDIYNTLFTTLRASPTLSTLFDPSLTAKRLRGDAVFLHTYRNVTQNNMNTAAKTIIGLWQWVFTSFLRHIGKGSEVTGERVWMVGTESVSYRADVIKQSHIELILDSFPALFDSQLPAENTYALVLVDVVRSLSFVCIDPTAVIRLFINQLYTLSQPSAHISASLQANIPVYYQVIQRIILDMSHRLVNLSEDDRMQLKMTAIYEVGPVWGSQFFYLLNQPGMYHDTCM